MDILIVNSPAREEFPPYMFPLNYGYIAAYLLEDGHNIHVLDIDGYRYSRAQVEQKLRDLLPSYDIVLTGGLIGIYNYVKWQNALIKQIKPSVTIIAGGSLVTEIPELALKRLNIDIGIMGEGEITCKKVVKALEEKKKWQGIAGVCYLDSKGHMVKNPPGEVIQNLDALPFPAWELFPIDIYVKNPKTGSGSLLSMNVSTVRGCPFDCRFCYRIYGRKTRFRSPQHVISEMKELNARYGVKYFAFADDLTLVSRRRILDLCDALISANLGFKWSASSRVDLVDSIVLEKMKKAGCNFIGFGVESLSQTMLDKMNKQVNVEKAVRAIQLTRKAGIGEVCSFILGFPGETKETVEECVRMRQKIGCPGDFFLPIPFPGTPLWDIAKERGLIASDEKYVETLEQKFTDNKPIVNFTDWTDEELVRIKEDATRRVNRHPYVIYVRISRYLRTHGLFALSNAVLRRGRVIISEMLFGRFKPKRKFEGPKAESGSTTAKQAA